MVQVDRSSLSPASTIAGVARSSDSPPELVLADRPAPRLITARWRRRSTRQHPPTRLDGHLLCYRECGGAPTHRGDHLPACRPRGGGGAREHGRGQPRAPVLRRRRPAPGEFDLVERTLNLLRRRLVALNTAMRTSADRDRLAPLPPWLLHVIERHVEQHLGERIPLARLAALASMPVDHFVRVFARATGSTPQRWILQRRLDAARERLQHGADPVGVVVRECGFAGAPHLAAAFRRRCGVTPTAFRRARPVPRGGRCRGGRAGRSAPPGGAGPRTTADAA